MKLTRVKFKSPCSSRAFEKKGKARRLRSGKEIFTRIIPIEKNYSIEGLSSRGDIGRGNVFVDDVRLDKRYGWPE